MSLHRLHDYGPGLMSAQAELYKFVHQDMISMKINNWCVLAVGCEGGPTAILFREVEAECNLWQCEQSDKIREVCEPAGVSNG